MRRRRGAMDISTSFDDLQFDAAVLELLFADLVASLSTFKFGFLHGIHLHEAIQLGSIAPFAVEVIEVNGAGSNIDNRGILPTRQLNDQAGRHGTEELG